ncbi:uncharacterized protein LOC143282338 [Babylonia areolata]|uniref:uncharacterized protein LOC143282338 n=1 Tax=Babylonia areolata TaxID=304850 RepID=UPI003FD4EC19
MTGCPISSSVHTSDVACKARASFRLPLLGTYDGIQWVSSSGRDDGGHLYCHPLQPFTVKRVLLDCWDLHGVRHRHYTAVSLKTLFRDVLLWVLMDFLKEVNIFNQI